ncbi:unnamed protein product [Echinostoma caproni]|uniref:Integrase catalytic domain-containing protein n=1 Tax=Echinostoma caproni TaxID=27848 RepID=A0A183BCM1_9TREM|nr:unnamed protein product [Echinostoma caproni]
MIERYKERFHRLESALKEARLTEKMTSLENFYSDNQKYFGESPAVESFRSLPMHADINDHPPKIVHGVFSDVLPKLGHVNRRTPSPSQGLVTLGEIVYFDGDSGRYWLFTRSFQGAVAIRVTDDESRLSYLIDYCKGEAKEAIECCAIVDPSEDYAEVLSILRRRFGEPHITARARIDELVGGPQIRNLDPVAFMKLAGEMRNCRNTLHQLNYVPDLNSSRRIAAIVGRMTQVLQFKWSENASCMLRQGREPTFPDLTEFVDERADVLMVHQSYSAGQTSRQPRSP